MKLPVRGEAMTGPWKWDTLHNCLLDGRGRRVTPGTKLGRQIARGLNTVTLTKAELADWKRVANANLELAESNADVAEQLQDEVDRLRGAVDEAIDWFEHAFVDCYDNAQSDDGAVALLRQLKQTRPKKRKAKR